MNQQEITEALARGRRDLRGADLRDSNLQGADLRGVDLREADLKGANLNGANLNGADLRDSNLYGVSLVSANLRGADLRGAHLYGADFKGADLRGADIYLAYLYGARLDGAYLTAAIAQGTLIGWKKLAHDIVATLEIPAEAKRTGSLIGRMCRASEARVLGFADRAKKPLEISEARSERDYDFVYRLGETVRPTRPYNPDITIECASGIHFFQTFEEARDYSFR